MCFLKQTRWFNIINLCHKQNVGNFALLFPSDASRRMAHQKHFTQIFRSKSQIGASDLMWWFVITESRLKKNDSNKQHHEGGREDEAQKTSDQNKQ